MADAVKVVAPANFEFVRGKGIHPFYLNMTLDEVIEAAVGWTIVSSERNEFGTNQTALFAKKQKQIEVCAINVRSCVPNAKSHYQVFWVSSYDAKLSDGRKISTMSRKKALKTVLVDYERNADELDLDEDIRDCVATYKTLDDMNTLFFSECDRHELRVAKVPPLEEE